jgi:hypothetical protein
LRWENEGELSCWCFKIGLKIGAYALIKKKRKFSSYTVYKEIQNGAVAKSYMRKSFLNIIYD